MVSAKHLKTDTGRDASEQVIIKNSHGVTVFQSFGHVIALTSAMRPTLINRERWDTNQTTLKYLKRFLGKDDYSKQELKLYLDMKHFRLVSDEVIETIWDIESGVE